jgi:hypothetical protein
MTGPHVPRASRTRAGIYQVSPLTGQKVPVDEFANHLKLEVQHPQHQRDLAIRKERFAQQNSGLADGDQIAQNLRQFARRAPEDTQEGERRVVWDGRQETIKKVVAETVLSLDETVQRPDLKREPPVIGPVFKRKKKNPEQ